MKQKKILSMGNVTGRIETHFLHYLSNRNFCNFCYLYIDKIFKDNIEEKGIRPLPGLKHYYQLLGNITDQNGML